MFLKSRYDQFSSFFFCSFYNCCLSLGNRFFLCNFILIWPLRVYKTWITFTILHSTTTTKNCVENSICLFVFLEFHKTHTVQWNAFSFLIGSMFLPNALIETEKCFSSFHKDIFCLTFDIVREMKRRRLLQLLIRK